MKIIYDAETGAIVGADALLLIDTEQFTEHELDDIYNGVGFPADCQAEAIIDFITEPLKETSERSVKRV